MSKYCPIITKALENHQNQIYCLEEDCAWWLKNANECAIVGLIGILENTIDIRRVE